MSGPIHRHEEWLEWIEVDNALLTVEELKNRNQSNLKKLHN